MNRKLYERLEEATARIEAVVFIAGMLGDGDSIAEPLSDLLDEDTATLKGCFPDMPGWLQEALDGHRLVADAFYEWAFTKGKLGFVVKIATPVMEHSSPTSSTYSWGRYMTSWHYGETLSEAVDQGLTWVAQRRLAEQSKPVVDTIQIRVRYSCQAYNTNRIQGQSASSTSSALDAANRLAGKVLGDRLQSVRLVSEDGALMVFEATGTKAAS